ncbi:asparagine synthase B [Aliikangiella coralliicola]|uniref:asparagine synthase (glutamine-hydrolyzing) n=1 Tax=Aliikangiella coralliicola TaxID=2592383 RepID=A0A545U7G7_9GAMM|nr:asparagine synthase B [Aliikangiella coralliicola]TQV85412.1 asparagine synthase B [Aliikangiella coralliicola]
MCSIFGILDIQQDPQALRSLALEQSKKQRHRGPDWSGIWTNDSAVLVHERLAIVDINSGEQPLLNEDGDLALLVNGEIYNHKALAQAEVTDYAFQTESDCEVLLGLYAEDRKSGAVVSRQQIEHRLNQLEGMFAFILFDDKEKRYLVARDPIGIIPLYYGYDKQRQLFVASEMKTLVDICEEVHSFPPGHYLDSQIGEIRAYYQPDWKDYSNVATQPASPVDIREAMVESVKKHMMSDVPYGVLLSGGLDSSVVSAIAQLNAAKRVEDDQNSPAWWPQLHSFAVGLKGSPDLKAAQKVAEKIGTIHHEIHFTVQQGLDALSDVIYHLETYDVTTVRASTPMFLMARKIKSMGIKMVLSGEGADEIFGGYLYFHKAPNAKEFHEETVRKLERLHQFDCLRANKSMAAWGVEARVPFLDRKFLDAAMSISPEAKMCGGGKIEKHILREAFEGYLPEEILWRQKEQFSDGVGYSWIDSLKDYAEAEISDLEFERAAVDFPINTPDTKEGLLYRRLFAARFNSNSAAVTVPGGKSIACSTKEALAWDASFQGNSDPSGRAVAGVHAMAI